MKKIIVTLMAVVSFCSCDSLIRDIDFMFAEKVTLKGKISTAQKMSGKSNARSVTNAFTLADAKKVMIFYGNDHVLENIKSDGTFSGGVPIGNSTVVAFLTENNEFIGNLFTGGLNFLPLGDLDENIKTIDLSTLTLDGTRVIPANDPIGKTIILSEAELEFMKEIGVFYESLVKNIDMDNDGKPDAITGKNFTLNTENGFNTGKFGVEGKSEPQILKSLVFEGSRTITIEGFTDWFSRKDRNIMYDAVLSGPSDNPHTDLQSEVNRGDFKDDEVGARYQLKFSRKSGLPLSSGQYQLLMDKTTFNFNYYFDLNMTDFWVYALPTLHVNANGDVTNVSFKYRFFDGRELNPKKIVSTSIGLMIGVKQLESNMDVYKSWGNSVEIVRQDIMTSLKKDHDFYNIKLKVPIKLNNIQQVQTTYFDMFGNRAGNDWSL